ncbi:MAG: hypothetical protein NVS4B3_21740 [Gemmatimonadaceae bacterium]
MTARASVETTAIGLLDWYGIHAEWERRSAGRRSVTAATKPSGAVAKSERGSRGVIAALFVSSYE